MRKINFFILLIFSQQLKAQNSFQLAPPLLKYSSIFFSDESKVEIKFAQLDATVHYTLNNGEPTEKDPVYRETLVLKKNFTTLKAKAFGKTFFPSETVAATFIKDGKKIKSIESTRADLKYPADGTQSLTDNKGGIDQLNSNTWLGYNCDTVTVSLGLEKLQPVKQVLLNFLQNESSWIFLPDQILIYWFDKKTNSFLSFGKQVIASDKETPGSQCNYRLIPAEGNITTNKLLINIVVKKAIPEWHPAKGQHAWMFMDEIKIY
jgi:hypothetical protein